MALIFFPAHPIAVKCEVFTPTGIREIQLCARPATQLRCPPPPPPPPYFRQIAHASPLRMREALSARGRWLKCCFTFTETVGLLGTGAQDGHLDFYTAPVLCKGSVPWIYKCRSMVCAMLQRCGDCNPKEARLLLSFSQQHRLQQHLNLSVG